MTPMTVREVSEADALQGKLLSPQTMQLLTNEIALLKERLCSIVFSANAEERETAILQYVELQAKMLTLQSLLDSSFETYDYLKALDNPGAKRD